MPKVNSTAIAFVRRRPGRTVVRFHDSGTYEYETPIQFYFRLRDSRSVGVTYNREVKGRFPVRKVG